MHPLRIAAVAAAAAVMLSVAAAQSVASHVPSFATLFADNVFLGGQVPPRMYRWVNPDTSIFVQFDRPTAHGATTIRYVGIGVRGTFCAETQPRGPAGGFTHFHRLEAPVYAQGHGGPPGAQGYWLTWVATDDFESSDKREIHPGVDYQFSPTPPPSCGGTPKPTFAGPGAHRLTRTEIRRLAAFFHDQPLSGGQRAPRYYRWVSADVAVFLQFDRADARKATALRYIGIAKRGRFLCEDQGTPDFAHFQRLNARTYSKGAGGKPGAVGLWHLAVRVDRKQGVDRAFERTRCPKA
jgi:hypothetical protein